MASLKLLSRFGIPALLLSAVGTLMPAQVQAFDLPEDTLVRKVSLTPNPATANKPFTLTVLGTGAACNTTFSHQSVKVDGRQIYLSYLASTYIVDPPILLQPGKDTAVDQRSPIYVCPIYVDAPVATDLILPAYGPNPAFEVPGLDAGEYKVTVYPLTACMVAKPACAMAPVSYPAGILTVKDAGPEPKSYSIAPDTAAAGEGFQLDLLSYGFNCATYFDNLNVQVSGNAITLTFLDHEKPGAICPAIYRPYGPAFKIPALEAGIYKVSAYRLPACYPCKLAGETAPAGVLTVFKGNGGENGKIGWFLKNRVVPPDQKFTMDLLNYAYGNCQTSFSHNSATIDGKNIRTQFVIERHPERVCVANISPYGPSFDMPALKLGIYPVTANAMTPCEYEGTRPCPIRGVPLMPFDTLIVAETITTRISDLRAKAPKVELKGSHAAFLLPEGIGGSWQAELVTVAGKRLRAATLQGEGGSRAEMDLGADLKTGVYLLRLQAPDGASHLIPIVR